MILDLIKKYSRLKKYHLTKLELDIIVVFTLTAGVTLGSYLTTANILIPNLFAATSPWNQSDWSSGEGGSTSNQYQSMSGIDATTTQGEFLLDDTSGWSADYASWSYRKKITFDNTDSNLGTTSEDLTNFPVLVKLDTGDDIDYAKTKDAGEDIRFTDSDGTVLSYEIEKWNEEGSSYVWVKVPQININSNTDYIYIYYGNTNADDGQDVGGVWSNGYVGIWHMNNDPSEEAPQMQDSTSSNIDGTTTGSMTSGQLISGKIGQALNFDGGDTVQLGSSEVLKPDDVTIEAWVNVQDETFDYYNGVISSMPSWGSGFSMHVHPSMVGLMVSGAYLNKSMTPETDVWYHMTGTHNSSTNLTTLYVDGLQANSTTREVFYVEGAVTTIGLFYTSGSLKFIGYIDEVRISNIDRSVAWIASSYKSGTDDFNTYSSEETKYPSSGYLVSNVFNAGYSADWGEFTYQYSGTGTVGVYVKSNTTSTISDIDSCQVTPDCIEESGTYTCTYTNLADSAGCVSDMHQYIGYKVVLTPSGASTPVFEDINFVFTASDQTAPVTNASDIHMYTEDGGREIPAQEGETIYWNNSENPYFSWTQGADNEGGGGLKGYCLYLGTSADADPGSSQAQSGTSGLLTDSPVLTTGTYCGFIVSSVNMVISNTHLSSALEDNTTYYFKAKAIDIAGNTFDGSATSFAFKHDSIVPVNVSYISTPQISFSNVVDMGFAWSTSGASDTGGSTLLGYQYQINSSQGTWKGTDTYTNCGFDYIPAVTGNYGLTTENDAGSIVIGNNVVYFRSVDTACNVSSAATYRTGNLSYGGSAPSFGGDAVVTITPSSATSNLFALSWPEANPAEDQEIIAYYYMVNTSPPSTLATLEGNSSTYMSNSTNLTVSSSALPNVNKGSNDVYVVAVDDADNYSPSNYIAGTFVLDSTDPDNPGSLIASDSSIKSSSQWNVTLTWTEPSYQGAGNLTYLIYRSTDGTSFSQVGSTTGLSYVDNTPSSALYYYKVYSKDGADALSSGTNAVSITPTGKWTSAPSLESGPTASSVTTKKATITWSTSRTSDSKVQFGTSSGSYNTEEPSNSSQVTSHSIQLTGLSPGITYHYKVKWTDEDGNTGESEEKSFTTSAAPIAKNVKISSLGLTSATISYTTMGASSVKIYYGTSTVFGAYVFTSTSTAESNYSTIISGLDDGTKYYYKINTFDAEGSEYEGTILDFETLPAPKITNVKIQEVKGTAQPTILITWETNTEVSSIVTYYPSTDPSQVKDEVNVSLTKGAHKMIVRGLLPQMDYRMIVKGRDKMGNEATSDTYTVTTSTDTRPPVTTNLKVDGSVLPSSEGGVALAQLVVSWNTDEPSSSQVEFGEGTGVSYSQKTQQDSNMTYNHLVVISNLTPSKVYHLRALSVDSAGNEGSSIDIVTITPKATESALNLVITNLSEVFGFLKKL